MNNQDLVALHLTRCPFDEINALIYGYGAVVYASWEHIIKSAATHQFLLSHGWDMNSYINACKDYIKCGKHHERYWLMHDQFIRAYE